MQDATGNRIEGSRLGIPRQMSVQDYRDQDLPPSPKASNQNKNPTKKSSLLGPKPPISTKPGQKKQSIPTISQPERQHSFQDYKNNIVPIPEPPEESRRGTQSYW